MDGWMFGFCENNLENLFSELFHQIKTPYSSYMRTNMDIHQKNSYNSYNLWEK